MAGQSPSSPRRSPRSLKPSEPPASSAPPSPAPASNPSNADLDPIPKSKKSCKRTILDRLILESAGALRRSPRIQTPGPEKRACVETDDDSDGDKGSNSCKRAKKRSAKSSMEEETCDLDPRKLNGSTFFVGDPVPEEEAKLKWPHRFAKKVHGASFMLSGCN